MGSYIIPIFSQACLHEIIRRIAEIVYGSVMTDKREKEFIEI